MSLTPFKWMQWSGEKQHLNWCKHHKTEIKTEVTARLGSHIAIAKANLPDFDVEKSFLMLQHLNNCVCDSTQTTRL